MADNKKMPDNRGKKYKRTVYDPRVDIFKQFYLKIDSYTFMNILQSALRAGYSEQYARNISVQRPSWWVDLMNSAEYNRAKMLEEAENRLYERVTEKSVDDVQRLKIQTDVAKFVTERLGKDKYSTRQELTGADGRRLFTNEQRATAKTPVAALFKGVKAPD
jgi:arginine/lysine/ornithine decarboxylase